MDEVIAKALKKLPKSDREKYKQCVFELYDLFFTIGDDSVSVMSSSAGGGCFGGPTDEEYEFIRKLMSELNFKLRLITKDACDYSDDDDTNREMFEEYRSKKDYAKYLQIEQRVKGKDSPFQFISACSRFDLGDELYYEWEGCLINLYDSISSSFDSLSDFEHDADDWKDIIENLDDYIVTPDNDYICEAED